MVRRLRAWLRSFPLQRRVAYLTTIAVALAVAVTSVAGYVSLSRLPLRWQWSRLPRTFEPWAA